MSQLKRVDDPFPEVYYPTVDKIPAPSSHVPITTEKIPVPYGGPISTEKIPAPFGAPPRVVPAHSDDPEAVSWNGRQETPPNYNKDWPLPPAERKPIWRRKRAIIIGAVCLGVLIVIAASVGGFFAAKSSAQAQASTAPANATASGTATADSKPPGPLNVRIAPNTRLSSTNYTDAKAGRQYRVVAYQGPIGELMVSRFDSASSGWTALNVSDIMTRGSGSRDFLPPVPGAGLAIVAIMPGGIHISLYYIAALATGQHIVQELFTQDPALVAWQLGELSRIAPRVLTNSSLSAIWQICTGRRCSEQLAVLYQTADGTIQTANITKATPWENKRAFVGATIKSGLALAMMTRSPTDPDPVDLRAYYYTGKELREKGLAPETSWFDGNGGMSFCPQCHAHANTHG